MSSAERIANIEEFPGGLQNGAAVRGRSLSLFRKRLRKFRTIKRGYYSFLIIVGAYAVSFFLPLLVNNEALAVGYHGRWYFPVAKYYPASTFGQQAIGEPDYRALAETLRREGPGNWVSTAPLPLQPHRIPAGPSRQLLPIGHRGSTFSAPTIAAGTSSRGWHTVSMYPSLSRCWCSRSACASA